VEYIECNWTLSEALRSDISECSQYSKLKQEIVMLMKGYASLHVEKESSIVLEYAHIRGLFWCEGVYQRETLEEYTYLLIIP
jgi:hypothetical protein